MSHEIWQLDNPFYGSRTPAWHGLGTVLEGQLSGEEAQEAAHLGWTVSMEPCYGRGGLAIPDAFVTVRDDLAASDDRRFFGVVGRWYTPIQNAEMFRLAEALIGEAGARFETAGSLKNGRIVWALAELPQGHEIRGDQVKNYLLLRSAHDGSAALEALATSIRVVCWNTMDAALRGTHNRVKVRHTAGATVNLVEARRILSLARDHFEEQANRLNRLAEVSIDDRFVEAFSKALYPDRDNQNNTRAQNARAEIKALFNGGQAGADHAAIRGTAYGLYNAMTEYVQHHTAPVTTKRSAREVAETRFESTLYGSHAAKRQRAFDLLCRATGTDGQGKGLMELVKVENGPTADELLADIDTGADRTDIDALLDGIDLG